MALVETSVAPAAAAMAVALDVADARLLNWMHLEKRVRTELCRRESAVHRRAGRAQQ